MMKDIFRIITLACAITFLAGCGGSESKTTDTTSDHFATLAGKQSFLERYVNFRRPYKDLEFDISYLDGGGGMVPGPTEWDVRILAKVPEESLDEWTAGLASTAAPEASWVSSIPNAPATLDSFQWYAEGSRIVGISRGDRFVLYRNHTN
jgi:hypothetical protein